MDRREFTVEAARLLLGGAVIAISGCGGAGTSPTVSSPPVTDVTGNVNSNHGHSATITSAQLLAGDAVQLDIRGSSPHSHSVTLSADDVVLIRRGVMVGKESTGNSHTHTVTFNG